MPIMRDRQTGVIRNVPQQTLDRWPGDYRSLTKIQRKALDELRDQGVHESHIVPSLRAALELAAQTTPKRAPARRSTKPPARAATDVPTVGTDTKG